MIKLRMKGGKVDYFVLFLIILVYCWGFMDGNDYLR